MHACTRSCAIHAARPARLLGIPLGDFGFFSSLLLSLASGFLAFFATCFSPSSHCSFWNIIGHHHVNYADSYLYVAFPIGLAVLALALVFFYRPGSRRKLSGTR